MRYRRPTGIIECVAEEVAHERAEPRVTDPAQPRKAKHAVMRIPGAAVVAIFLLTFGMTPIAWTVPGLLVLYVIPAVLLYWVLRVRTTATPEGLHVRDLLRSHRLSWDDVRGLSVSNRGKVSAVTADGATVGLPAVRSRNLPALSLISGGRVPDPTGLTSDMTREE